MKKYAAFFILVFISVQTIAQDLLSLVENDSVKKKEYILYAFKSSRVVNSHSMEMIGKGVMDVRILHRFGELSSGFNNLFGLDQANMRFGFDYGLLTNLTIGIGRSNVGKEWDAFIKFRLIRQSTGSGSFPFSVLLITGTTISTQPWSDATRKNYFSNRMAFYHEVIIGRKFNEKFSLQFSPIFVHRNIVPLATNENDIYALGIGYRFKISKRTAFVMDYHYVTSGLDKAIYKNPLSIGFDIETGGHVFQLHFSNATGMNEKAFITNTTNKWGKGEIRFGFNLSRVFTVSKSQLLRE